jgi:hypothetical protein
MKLRDARRLFVGAGFGALIACAAQPEVQAPRNAAPGGETVTAVQIAPAVAGGYRRIMKEGVEYYCRSPVVTGSRMQRAETCLTKAQLEAMAEQSEAFVRSLQGPVFADGPPVSSPMGGLF